MILLDTNVVSELMKDSLPAAVEAWVRARKPDELFTTSVTLAEVLYGIERLPNGRRKDQLRGRASAIFETFRDQVLSFDGGAAVVYPSIVDGRDRGGRPIDGFDAQIASICRSHDATLATRNVRDFEHTGVEVVDPWREG